MNREEALKRAIEFKNLSVECEGCTFIESDIDFFGYVIKEIERTAQEVSVQEQSNNLHILRIQNNTLMLDNFILKSITSYKLSNDASKGISEININLIVNSSKIDF